MLAAPLLLFEAGAMHQNFGANVPGDLKCHGFSRRLFEHSQNHIYG
jgi:hypothetical protein